ncbi:MAG: hypothetical protein AAFZ15_34350 [Bacteroidota bacterium]
MDYSTFRFELLKKEIDLLNQKINHFDNLRMKTKQMSLILWTAVIGFGLKENVNESIFFLASSIPIPFWIMETRYKTYYKGFYLRIRVIRDFISKGEYLVGNSKLRAELDQFLSNRNHSNFPVFDYWGVNSVSSDIHAKDVNFWKNFFSGTNLWIYLPMTVSGFIIGVYHLFF